MVTGKLTLGQLEAIPPLSCTVSSPPFSLKSHHLIQYPAFYTDSPPHPTTIYLQVHQSLAYAAQRAGLKGRAEAGGFMTKLERRNENAGGKSGVVRWMREKQWERRVVGIRKLGVLGEG